MCETKGTCAMADKMNMNEFLQQYFGQLRFNAMPAEVRAQFDDIVAADDFLGNQKDWKKKYLVENPVGSGKYDNNTLPNAEDTSILSDDDATKLFREFETVFRSMKANEETFKKDGNTAALNFLNDNFGVGRVFDATTANDEAEEEIAKLRKLINAAPHDIEQLLKKNGELSDDFSFRDLVEGIDPKNKKYNTKPDFTAKLQSIARTVSWEFSYSTEGQEILSNAKKRDASVEMFDAEKIEKGFETAITPDKLEKFRKELPEMLNTIHREKKVREAVKANKGEKIVTHYDNAITDIGYDNKESDDFVQAKRDDKLTPWQQLSKNVSDNYNDLVAKYAEFKGDKNFVKEQAKNIFDAMTREKIKPTDGLGALLDKKDAIKSRLLTKIPRSAGKHFDWTVKTLSELKDTMPKAFEGCLKNGAQMRRIVEELCIKAAEDAAHGDTTALPAAKTAMEVLSVMQYGLTTSKIMDTLRQEDFTLFSDGKLSWNKNEGMRFLSAALDKSIKYAFLTAGYAVTMVGNAYKMRGSVTKFNNRSTDPKNPNTLHAKSEKWESDNARNKADKMAEYYRRNLRDAVEIAGRRRKQQDAADDYQSATGTDALRGATDFTDVRNDLQARRLATEARRNTWQTNRDSDTGVQQLDEHNALEAQLTEARTRRDDLQAQLNEKMAEKGSLSASTTDPDIRKQLIEKWAEEAAKIQKDLNDAEAAFNDAESAYNGCAYNALTPAQQAAIQARANDFQTEDDLIKQEVDKNNKAEAAINAYADEHGNINEIQALQVKRDEVINTWEEKHVNVYQDLMSYWDFLQDGRLTHSGPTYSWTLGSAKEKQKDFFNGGANAALAAYRQKHGYAA